MNEQTKKLAEQAGCYHEQDKDGTKFLAMPESAWERFAELIRDDERDKCAGDYLQDCSDAIDAERKACAEHYLSIMRDAVEQAILREREACAKLCEEYDNDRHANAADLCAAAIRAKE